ncbi:MAG: hypothetical protein CBC34_003705, partial [Hyphomicrobiaceae bacterium TMED74]
LLSRELAGSHQPGYAAFSDSHRHQVLRIAPTLDAVRYWLEQPTAVAVRLNDAGKLEVLAPFGLGCLFGMRGEPTPSGLRKYDQYIARMRAKAWSVTWPKVRVQGLG